MPSDVPRFSERVRRREEVGVVPPDLSEVRRLVPLRSQVLAHQFHCHATLKHATLKHATWNRIRPLLKAGASELNIAPLLYSLRSASPPSVPDMNS